MYDTTYIFRHAGGGDYIYDCVPVCIVVYNRDTFLHAAVVVSGVVRVEDRIISARNQLIDDFFLFLFFS